MTHKKKVVLDSLRRLASMARKHQIATKTEGQYGSPTFAEIEGELCRVYYLARRAGKEGR